MMISGVSSKKSRWAVAPVVGVAIALLGGVARADGSSPALYVSDQFRTVATRVASQVTVDLLAKACANSKGEAKVLCASLISGAGPALSAAILRDDNALKSALGKLIVDGAANGLLYAVSGPLFRLQLDPSLAKVVTSIAEPVLECISAVVQGERANLACDPKKLAIAGLKDVVEKDLCRPGSYLLLGNDCPNLIAFEKKVASGSALSPADAVAPLIALTSHPNIARPDLRLYLMDIQKFLIHGPENGLFDATWAFLEDSRPGAEGAVVTWLTRYASPTTLADRQAAAHFGYWTTAHDSAVPKLLASCGQDANAWNNWVAARDGALVQWAADIANYRSPHFDLINPLLAYGCLSGKAEEVANIEGLRKHFLLLRGALEIQAALDRYGIVALAAAALLDYVASNDEARLQHDARRIALYGGELLAHLVGPNTDSSKVYELVLLDIALGTHEFDAPAGAYLSLAKGSQVNYTPSTASADAVMALVTPLLDSMARKLSSVNPEAAQLLSRHLQDVVALAGQVGRQEWRSGERSVARLGLDLLAEETDHLIDAVLGKASEKCDRDARSRSILTGIDALCAAHVLLESAYHPILDYYWKNGVAGADDAKTMMSQVYTSLLANEALDFTPIILDLGLGASYAWGDQGTWGAHGTVGLTLLDKIGLAFYKYNGDDWRFQTGPFVGGFLDSLVRVLADSQSHKFWLAGYTIGFPRISKIDLGVELHVAAALPYDLSNAGSQTGLDVGLALIVPFSSYLQGK
jgi:hypothetical protein